MSLVSPTRNVGMPRPNKKVKDRLPSFQQLQQTKNKSSAVASSAATDKTAVPHPIISPTSTAESTEDDMDMISTTPIVSFARLRQHQHHQGHESDSLSQWDDDAPNDTSTTGLLCKAYHSVITPPHQIGGLAAMKELDIALNRVASSSEANYSMGEETAVTGNMSAFSSPHNAPFLTTSSSSTRPRNTPKSNLSSCRQEDESPEPTNTSTSRRLFMCGAVDVTTEMKGSFQDVNDTVRQIFTTVRRFGPNEKEAVKDTLKEAQSFMKQRVLAGILANNRCGGGGAAKSLGDDDDDEEYSDLRDNNSSRRRDRDATARGRKITRSTVHDARRRRGREGNAKNVYDFAQESEEVVYDKRIHGMESSELERLKAFEC